MKVFGIMHRGATSIAPETPVIVLARMMRDMDIGALPVVQGSQILGIVTDRDVAMRAVLDGRDLSALTAGDVMSGDVVCCRQDEEAHRAIRRMEGRKVRRLPVIDGDKLVGMLSLGDIAHVNRADLTDEVMKAVSAHHSESCTGDPESTGDPEKRQSNIQSAPATSGRASDGCKEPININRAVGRAIARVQGNHPRRGRKNGLFLTLVCDLGLILAGALALAGVTLIVMGLIQGFSAPKLLTGISLGALSVVLLVIWERVFWQPLAARLSHLT